ncbi:MAG TPA: hypothetical protein ENJ53_00460 [Phaeodactylibacter sp.]|nr:hypothetical protein [Phaeodactylibacter sp.]
MSIGYVFLKIYQNLSKSFAVSLDGRRTTDGGRWTMDGRPSSSAVRRLSSSGAKRNVRPPSVVKWSEAKRPSAVRRQVERSETSVRRPPSR